jgi:hypothetical protein
MPAGVGVRMRMYVTSNGLAMGANMTPTCHLAHEVVMVMAVTGMWRVQCCVDAMYTWNVGVGQGA